MDGDLCPRGRAIGVILRDRVVKPKLASFNKLHDAGGGELLGDGSRAELGVRGIGHAPFLVGEPVAFAKNRLAIASHKYRSDELVLLDVGADELVGLGGEVLRGVLGMDQRETCSGEN